MAFELPTSPEFAYRVRLRDTGWRYVNPYLGELLDQRNTLTRLDHLFDGILALHVSLLDRTDSGRLFHVVPRWSAVAIVFVLCTGVYLWWPVKRISIRNRGSARQFWYDVHNSSGVFFLFLVLALAVSGIAIGWEQETASLLRSLVNTNNTVEIDDSAIAGTETKLISLDQALAVAKAALPGAVPVQIDTPTLRRLHHISLRYPSERGFGQWPPLTSGVDRPRNIVIVDRVSEKLKRVIDVES